jgi:hypothetical protein
MDEAPKLHYVLIPIVLGGIFGVIAGIYLTWGLVVLYKQIIVVICSIFFSFIGWQLSRWFLGKREDFFYYEYNMSLRSMPEPQEAFSGTVVLSLKLEDGSSKEIRGLTENEWTRLGEGVRSDGGYSTRILVHIFGAGRGGTIYEIITDILKSAKVLRDKGSGVEPTEKGWRFFAHLENCEYEVLNMLPDSPPPLSRVDA